MTIDDVFRLLELIRSIHPDLTCGQAQTLLEIMRHDDPPTMSELASRTNSPITSISRHCAQFGPVRRITPKAFDLIRLSRDPEDRRVTRIELSPKGKLLQKQIREIISR